MSLSIRLNGATYVNFLTARVSRSIETLTGVFSFSSSADINNLFPIKVGDNVQILADTVTVLTGYVDSLEVVYDASQHVITVNGRGILSDLIDSSVKTTKEFTGGTSLSNIARTVLNDLGLTAIDIINNAGTIDSFDETDIASVQIGQKAFCFLEAFARKRQVFLNESSDGDLVMSRGSSEYAPMSLQNVVITDDRHNDNNVKSATLQLDNSNRFYQYKIQAQLNPILQSLTATPDKVSDQNGSATDSLIRKTRYCEIQSEESQVSGSAGKRAEWECNIRRSRAFNYIATIFGHTVNGAAFFPNTLIKVVDNFCKVDSDLLIRSVEYTYDLDNGAQTVLTCAPKDSYTLEAEQNQRNANTSMNSEGFLP